MGIENKKKLGIDLEAAEKEEFQKIADREEHGKISRLGRKIILDYIKGHSVGNPNFSLDSWDKDPGFQAVPSILNQDWKVWKQYFDECNAPDFFKLLKALNERRDQAIAVMNTRKLRKEDLQIKFVEADESSGVPTGLSA